jgi:hypothetical protein
MAKVLSFHRAQSPRIKDVKALAFTWLELHLIMHGITINLRELCVSRKNQIEANG